MSFLLGCAVWGYKEWVGELFPAGSRAADFLSLYSRRFNTVEGNTTFYSVPDEKTVARWAETTPPGFEFCLKLPKTITHQGSLIATLPETLAFLDRMSSLGDRLGPVFAQLPPGYSPAQWEDLVAFLQAFPHERVRLALEVRHLDWFRKPHAERLNDILRQVGAGRVLLDTRPIYDSPDDPQLQSERRKPRVPLQPVVTSDFSLIRFISHPDLQFNQSYLEAWAVRLTPWLRQGTRIYFFMHCPIEARSPANARYFQHILEEQQVPVPPLPWNHLDQPPAQLSLF